MSRICLRSVTISPPKRRGFDTKLLRVRPRSAAVSTPNRRGFAAEASRFRAWMAQMALLSLLSYSSFSSPDDRQHETVTTVVDLFNHVISTPPLARLTIVDNDIDDIFMAAAVQTVFRPSKTKISKSRVFGLRVDRKESRACARARARGRRVPERSCVQLRLCVWARARARERESV